MSSPTQQKIDEYLLASTITLDGNTFRVSDIVGISMNGGIDLNGGWWTDALIHQSTRLASFGVLVASARRDYETVKHNREISYSEAFREARIALKASGDRITDAAMETVARVDELYIESVNKEVEALEAYLLLKAVYRALKERGRMLGIIYGQNGTK